MDTTASGEFYARVRSLMDEVMRTQGPAFRKGAAMMADRICDGRLVYCAGTGGHSQIAAAEMLYRAGGLACIYPIAPIDLIGPSRAVLDRTPGHMDKVVALSGFSKGDLLIVLNAYGINAATIDACLAAQRLGGEVLAITATSHSVVPAGHPTRHPSGLNLHEVADHYIDCKMPYGDAALELPGFDRKICAVSIILVCFCVQCLVAETVQELLNRGVKPEVWVSGNTPEGDLLNQAYLKKYYHRVKALR